MPSDVRSVSQWGVFRGRAAFVEDGSAGRAELEDHRQTVVTRGKRTTTIFRWLSAVSMRATDDALIVNWFSIEILNGKGNRTYYNSFVTGLAVMAGTVAELGTCGRDRWKIGNETFNMLETNGYNLEHNLGHGNGNSNGALRQMPRSVPPSAPRRPIALPFTTPSGSCVSHTTRHRHGRNGVSNYQRGVRFGCQY